MLFVVAQSLNPVRFFVTPWTAARQVSLFFTTFRSLLKLISIELVMDREAWRAVVHEVTKSQTRLSDWTKLNLTKQKQTHRLRERLRVVRWVRQWGKEVREFGMVMSILLCLKWITNKDLLYRTWNPAQCYVAAWMGGKFGEEWIHVYVWLSPFSVHYRNIVNRLWVWKLLSGIQLFVIPWTVACRIPLSMEFSRQNYWSK